MKLSSLDVLADLHDQLCELLPLVPADDPFVDRLTKMEAALRVCRRRPEHPDPALSPAGALALRQPVT